MRAAPRTLAEYMKQGFLLGIAQFTQNRKLLAGYVADQQAYEILVDHERGMKQHILRRFVFQQHEEHVLCPLFREEQRQAVLGPLLRHLDEQRRKVFERGARDGEVVVLQCVQLRLIEVHVTALVHDPVHLAS